ncbi:MAG: hypothetical protein P8X95_23960 [Anaerolineales bacterium]
MKHRIGKEGIVRSFSEDQAKMATRPPGFTTRASSFTSGKGSIGAYPTQSTLQAQSKAGRVEERNAGRLSKRLDVGRLKIEGFLSS